MTGEPVLCLDGHGGPVPYAKAYRLMRQVAARHHGKLPAGLLDVDDLVQDAVLALLPAMPFEHPAALALATRYKIIDAHRGYAAGHVERGGRPLARYMEDVPDTATPEAWLADYSDPAAPVVRADLVAWVMALLSPSQREFLNYYAEHGAKATAAYRGTSVAAVRHRIHYIRNYIKEYTTDRPPRRYRVGPTHCYS